MGRTTYTSKIPKIVGRIDMEIDAVVQRGAHDILERAQTVYPYTRRTGDLIASGEVSREDAGRAVVSFDMDYAAPVELGARNARTGRDNKPYPYLRPAFDTIAPRIISELGIVMKRP